jgi:DNA-binding NarL/FixJ family response regulator
MGPRKPDGVSKAESATRILLVDDHPLVREGLAEVLQREGDLVVCGEAEDRWEALKLIETAKPHLALVDLALKKSSGLELIKEIQARFPEVRVLVVSMQDELFHAERAIRAGASGFISKEQAVSRVVEAVRQVLAGQVFVSPAVAASLAAKLAHRPHLGSGPCLDVLTDRELEVLELIGEGLGRNQVAERLHLDVSTVETYRARLKEKLQLKDAQELLQFAIRFNRQRKPC